MRLVCPNCDAQYEVDKGAIPPEGRDVQCSACGHGWFQLHPDHTPEPETEDLLAETAAPDRAPAVVQVAESEPAPEPEAEAPARDETAETAPPVPEPAPAPAEPEADAPDPGPAPVAEVVTEPEPEAEPSGAQAEPEPPAPSDAPEPTDDEAAPGDGPAPAAPPRRSLDDAVMAVLREEAEREAAARRAEAARGIETQPDLGLPAAAPVAAAAATLAATAAHSGAAGHADDDDHPISQRHGAARRDLLPDIEEINSSLRAGAEPREASEPDGGQPAGTDRGFRSGFVAILVIAAVLVALYVMAPRIATLIPGSAGTMEAYVTTVDGLRTGLDSLLQRATALLRGATGG